MWHAFSYQPLATYATIFRLILISSTTRKSPARSGGLNFELTAQKELVIMSTPGPGTGRHNNESCYALTDWAKKDKAFLLSVPTL